ncbi:hypothetical protein TNCV_4972341 [Trichonephila clavipes]|nr:hypothetical protein TNCV_4972341 [Trichonephila clavipes]
MRSPARRLRIGPWGMLELRMREREGSEWPRKWNCQTNGTSQTGGEHSRKRHIPISCSTSLLDGILDLLIKKDPTGNW